MSCFEIFFLSPPAIAGGLKKKSKEKKISISVQRLVVSIIAYNNITKNPTFLTYIKLIIMLYPRYKIKLILDRVI